MSESGGPESFALYHSKHHPSRLLFCAVASASLSSLPAQPGNPAAFLVQAQTRPGSLDSTAAAGISSQPSDHFSLVFVAEEFLVRPFGEVGVGGHRRLP